MAEPRLRFKDDNGNAYPVWQEYELDEVLTERNEPHLITKDAPQLSFTIEQGVIYPEDKKRNKRDFLMKDKGNKKFLLTEYNDIIYNPANLKFGAIHRNALGRGVVSPIYAIFYTDQNPAFIEGIVTNPKFIKSSLKYLEGTVVKLMTLKPKDFVKMKVWIPCLEEQQKIADFLSTVDNVISTSEEEVANLETQKKAVMKKIFSQEVRFKREDGTDFPEWEEKNIDDLGEIIGGGTPKTSVEEYWNGDTPWISSADLEENNIHVVNITRYITKDAIDNSATKRVPKDAILIISRVGVGKVAVSPCELCTSQDYMSVVPCTGNIVFLGYAISKLMQDKSANVQGTSIKGIPSDEIKAYSIGIPCLEEQRLIADFLSTLDEAISAAKKELDLWKQLKKGLLQQMFV